MYNENEFLTNMKKERTKVKKELRRMPEGALMIQMTHGLPVFLRVTYGPDGKRRREGIGRKLALVYKLAHKAFLEEKLRRIEHNIAVLEKPSEKILPTDDQSVVGALSKNYCVLDYPRIVNTSRDGACKEWPRPVGDGSARPVVAMLDIGGMDVDEWARLPYCENTKYREKKIHRTSNGLLCRTKGEVALIELCNKLGYRYHYDETIWLCGKRKSPDLILVRDDGTLVYVEHRGWEGEQYDNGNMEKDNLYFKSGIRLGRNYLITFEKAGGGLDDELVELQLRRIMEC